MPYTRSWTTFLALCVVTAAGAVAPAPPVAAGPPSPITLRKVNVVEGRESGAVEVRIPSEVEVDLILQTYRDAGPTRSVSIDGGGRAVGLVLAPPPPVGEILNSPTFFAAGRFGECGEPGCDPQGEVVNFQEPFVYPGGEGARSHTLAPGDYRLYLIADGAPVRIKLVLRGLKGRTRITPAAPAPVDLKTPTVHASYMGGPSYFMAGDTFDGGRRGIALSLLSLHGPVDPAYSSYGMCGFYRTTVNLPDEVAYGPHCHVTPAGGGAFGTWNDADRFDVVFLQGYGDSGFPPSDLTRGHGVWFESHRPVSKVTSHIFTLVLD